MTQEEPDRGADGPASLSRPSSVRTVGGRIRGSASPGQRIDVRVIDWECKIDQLNHRGYLADRLWAAGCQFRRYWFGHRMQPRVISNYEGMPGQGRITLSEYRLHCRQRVAEAEAQLSEPERLAVVGIAGEDEDNRRRIGDLRSGLTVLADFWGIPEDFCRTGE